MEFRAAYPLFREISCSLPLIGANFRAVYPWRGGNFVQPAPYVRAFFLNFVQPTSYLRTCLAANARLERFALMMSLITASLGKSVQTTSRKGGRPRPGFSA